MADNKDQILDLDYEEKEFVQMMAFLKEKEGDFSPYLSQQDDGYTYVFATQEQKDQFELFFKTNNEVAMQLYKYRWKNGVEKYMVINILNGYSHDILLNSKGNTIEFEFYSSEGAGSRTNEPGTANITITNDDGIKTIQAQYGISDEKVVNLDNYLVAGANNISIQITGHQSGKSASTSVIFNVTEIDLDADFNIAKIYGSGETAQFEVKPKCNVSKYVEFWLDKETQMTTQTQALQASESRAFVSLKLPTSVGKHILQMRCRAEIGGKICYSRTLYCEFVIRGEVRDFITISRKLQDSNIIQGEENVTIHCEQYVQEDIAWAYIPYRQGTSPIITWKLEPTGEGDSTTLATRVTDGTTIEEGTIYHLIFLPQVTGTFYLKAEIGEFEGASYYTEIIKNTNGLEETTNGLRCKFSALGRSNEEPEGIRDVWENKGYRATFVGVPFTNGCGWVNDTLLVANGAKVEIDVKPFIDLRSGAMATTSATVEIDFETTNIKDENAVVLSIGDRLKITGNAAEMSSISGVTVKDKFTANTRLKLAFIVHDSSTSLMEIINNGISSRCASYGSSYFLDSGNIIIGNTTEASIKIYSIRVYQTSLSTQQELRNVIIDSEDIAAMVERNNIYRGAEIDISLIEDRIACLYVTGKGGTNKLSTIWDSTNKVQIYGDVRWRNPNNPESNWDCEAMRIRSHGQSTLANPLKSLKVWMKDDATDSSFTTKFYPNGSTEPSEDPRWSMKNGAMPMNKFVFQCYYIDSSNCKSPALLRMIDTAMKGADVITPPMKYARDKYGEDMKRIHGTSYSFPYQIRMTPDSIPCVIVSRDSESDKWHYDGIFVLMDDKKSDYLYGERSIYSAIGDPFCFDTSKKLHQTLWDNKEVTRWEFLSNSHPISTFKDISSFFAPPIDYVEDDDLPEDPNEVETLAEGGDGATAVPSAAGYAFEQAIEIIYPDRDDLDDVKYLQRAQKVYEFFEWANGCYKVDNGGSESIKKLWNEAPDHMDLEHWACYYVFAMMNGTFDNLVRNMQLTTFDGEHWLPLWWDIDIQYGTINSGSLAFDTPPVDRTTENNYGIAFRGQDCFLWNALEGSQGFIELCHDMLNRLSSSYNKEAVIALQKEYTSTWSESLYNESEEYKYKQMYLKDKSGNAKFLAYLLGNGDTFREWWMTKNYRYWESRLGAGTFVSQGVSWRYSDIFHEFSIRLAYGEKTFFGWEHKQKLQMIGNAYSVEVNPGEVKVITLPEISQSDRLYFFNPQSLEMIDLTDSVEALQDIDFKYCNDPNTGTMLKELYMGLTDAALSAGLRNRQLNEKIGNLNVLTMLEVLQLQGIIAPTISYSIVGATNIRELYLKGSSFAEFTIPNSVHLDVAELPDTLQSISWNDVKFAEGGLRFYDPETLSVSTFPHGAMTLEFSAMGKDPMIRSLISQWLTYKESQNQIGSCKLSVYNIAWQNATYEEVLRLAKISKNQRNYTGVIILNRALDSDEMYELQNLFNDEEKGIDVFSSSSAFQIDCDNGVSVSAPSSILSGNSYQLKAVVFPLVHKSQIVKYMIQGGRYSDATKKWTLNNAVLDQNTGLLEVVENATGTNMITVLVEATTVVTDGNGNDTTIINNTSANIQLIARTYPTKVELSGVTSIESISGDGKVEINAIFTPSGTNGNIDEASWSYNTLDCITGVSKDHPTKFIFYVSSIDSSTQILNLRYTVKFKNGRSYSASLVITIHEPERIMSTTSNAPVYDVMEFHGIAANGYMTDMQAWSVRDEVSGNYFAMPWEELSAISYQITHFEEIRFFRYLTYIDFENWHNLDTSDADGKVEDYDFIEFENLTSVKMKGTIVSVKNLPNTVTILELGAPENVNVSCTNLTQSNFSIQDVTRIKSVSFDAINYGFKTFANLIRRKNDTLTSRDAQFYDANGAGYELKYSINAHFDDADDCLVWLELIETRIDKVLSSGSLVSTTSTKRYKARIEILQDIDESRPETRSRPENSDSTILLYSGWRDIDNAQIKVRLIANEIDFCEQKWAEATIKLNEIQ